MKKFSINNHRLGTAAFDMDAPISAFYKAAGIAVLWIVAVFLVGALKMGFSLTALGEAAIEMDNDPTAAVGAIAIFYLVFFIGFIPAAVIYQAMTRNAIYNGTTLDGGHCLTSNVSAPQLFWIAISNLVVVVCKLGLMLPWAQIRIARYLVDHTGVVLGSSVDDFIGTQLEEMSALGDAYSDIEGIDLGLPI